MVSHRSQLEAYERGNLALLGLIRGDKATSRYVKVADHLDDTTCAEIRKLDLPGVGLVSAGMFGIVWGLIRGNELGWTSPEILAALGLGIALVAAFVAWELRAPHPMLPMTFFRNAAFSLANLASLFMFFGMFGSIFLLTQFFQTVQGYSPLSSGLRILPWTLAPMFIAPFAGAMSDRVSPKRILSIGLTLQAIALGWIAFVGTPTTAYSSFIVPFILAGVGMALFFTPMANLVLSTCAGSLDGAGWYRRCRVCRAHGLVHRTGAQK